MSNGTNSQILSWEFIYDYCIQGAWKHTLQLSAETNQTNAKAQQKISCVPKIASINADQFKYCIIVWDVLICTIIHLIVGLVCAIAIGRHRIGKLYSILVLVSSLVHPITVGVVCAMILGEIMRQILLKEDDCNPLNDTLSFNAMVVAGVLNICMCVSAYLTRRNFRFI